MAAPSVARKGEAWVACRAVASRPEARLRPAGFGAAALLASRAKAGGGRRTRTFEVMRRLIYS
jgi:hypothetical protein